MRRAVTPRIPNPLRWLPASGLFVFLMGVAVLTTRSSYAAFDLLLLGLLYALLAFALSCLTRLLARQGMWLELAGALFVGLVAAWHLREQLRPAGVGPTLWTATGMVPFLGSALLGAMAYLLLGRLASPGQHAESRLRSSLVVSSAVFFTVLLVSYGSSDTLRWHLLRHNKLIGTPVFHLLGSDVRELEERDWARHGNGAIIQPEWVHSTRSARESDQLASATAVGSAAGTQATGQQTDVVFILIDTLRADALSAYGGDPSLMPALNSFADTALVFSDVLANSSWTRPSVASFFTGLAPEEHGAVDLFYPISPGVVTMAEVFQRRGYETAAFVANHEAVNANGHFNRGFGHFEPLDDPGQSYARADFVTDRVSGWIADRGSSGEGRPKFLYIHYLDPHVPYLSSGEARLGVASHDEARALYQDEVRFLDPHLERLLGALEGLSESRVIFVTSDHGEEFGEHDTRGHAHTLYSEVLAIPAILRIEGGRRHTPSVVEHQLEGRDFFELLLRIAEDSEISVPRLAQSLGRDLRVASVSFSKDSGAIHNLLRPYRNRIYSRMAQRDGWRLIWSAYGSTHELYDLNTDPAETRNVVARRPNLAATLKTELESTPRYWSRPGTIGLSEESLERLRGLGYIR